MDMRLYLSVFTCKPIQPVRLVPAPHPLNHISMPLSPSWLLNYTERLLYLYVLTYKSGPSVSPLLPLSFLHPPSSLSRSSALLSYSHPTSFSPSHLVLSLVRSLSCHYLSSPFLPLLFISTLLICALFRPPIISPTKLHSNRLHLSVFTWKSTPPVHLCPYTYH